MQRILMQRGGGSSSIEDEEELALLQKLRQHEPSHHYNFYEDDEDEDYIYYEDDNEDNEDNAMISAVQLSSNLTSFTEENRRLLGGDRSKSRPTVVKPSSTAETIRRRSLSIESSRTKLDQHEIYTSLDAPVRFSSS
jgi:hypothetical protein